MVKNLWILEDQADILELTAFLGNRMGFNVASATSVKQAWELLDLALLHRANQAPGWIVTDFQLRDGDSLLWVMAVLCVFPKVNVLCMSGGCGGMEETFQKLRIHFLQKPTRLSDLVKFLQCTP